MKIFISYSWDSEEHKQWVQKLAEDLDSFKELDVAWDGFDLDALSDKNYYMEKSIHEADVVIIVATQKYKQKADSRNGGVGIETYMSSAIHWNQSNAGGDSKFILIQKEPESIPRYLEGKIYTDFTKDSLYSNKLQVLINILKKSNRVPRPPKLLSINSVNTTYSFTRAEDILRLNHRKRIPLITGHDGTDFSGSNRIKFEFWKTISPNEDYFLFIFNNITINQTINRLCNEIKNRKIHIEQLTLLRPSKGEDGLVQSLIIENGLKIKITELTYSEYIWHFAIDDEIKDAGTVYQIPFYTDQAITFKDDLGNLKENESSLATIIDILDKESSNAAHLLIAPGGMGKTTLCLKLIDEIQKRNNKDVGIVFIQADSLRQNLSGEIATGLEIKNIYDLYDFHSRVHKLGSTYGQAAFELSILCGNLYVVIDGLDELTSIFQGKFKLDEFLKSISELHEQMGKSRILLTSRSNNLFDENSLLDYKIDSYELLGFDESSCKKYSRKRFGKYSNSTDIIEKLDQSIKDLVAIDQSKRVLPFYIDVVATIFEQQHNEGNPISFNLVNESKDYESNNGLIDLIVYSVFKREQVRQEIKLSIKEQIDIISEVVADHRELSIGQPILDQLNIFYGDQGKTHYDLLIQNPLFVSGKSDSLRFRYDFLNNYFTVIYLIDAIRVQSTSKTFIQCLSKQISSDESCLKDVRLYFLKDKNILHQAIQKIITAINKQLAEGGTNEFEIELKKRAIGCLLRLFESINKLTTEKLSVSLRKLYGIPEDLSCKQKINGLFIYGDFPPLNFSNLEVWNSKFSNYNNFLTSKFDNSKFYYCKFEGINNEHISDTFSGQIFDSTCDIGDLDNAITHIQSTTESNNALIEAEFKKFIRSFYKNANFKDQKKSYINFSTKVASLNARNFDNLIKIELIDVSREKSNEIYYKISLAYEQSIYNFLINNFQDAKIKKIIVFLST